MKNEDAQEVVETDAVKVEEEETTQATEIDEEPKTHKVRDFFDALFNKFGFTNLGICFSFGSLIFLILGIAFRFAGALVVTQVFAFIAAVCLAVSYACLVMRVIKNQKITLDITNIVMIVATIIFIVLVLVM